MKLTQQQYQQFNALRQNVRSQQSASSVRQLQTFLKKTVDPKLNVTGTWDKQTQADVKAFQAQWAQDSFQPAAAPAKVNLGGSSGYGNAGVSAAGVSSGADVASSGAANVSVDSTPVSVSGSVMDWIKQALALAGIPDTPENEQALATIIQHESGGDPNAINLTDSNAVAGHPSQGLMQTIPSTFAQYALPGHNNIVNPVDNIIAGARYAIATYGSLQNVPGVKAVANGGSYMGY